MRSLDHEPFPGSPYTAAEEDAFGAGIEKELEVSNKCYSYFP